MSQFDQAAFSGPLDLAFGSRTELSTLLVDAENALPLSPASDRSVWGESGVADAATMAKHKDKFPDVKLYRVEEEFGGWDKLNAEHLNAGAKLDLLFGGK